MTRVSLPSRRTRGADADGGGRQERPGPLRRVVSRAWKASFASIAADSLESGMPLPEAAPIARAEHRAAPPFDHEARSVSEAANPGDDMKIAIVGTGAMGSVYAGLLGKAGHEVWAIDVWQEHIDAIASHRLERLGGQRQLCGRQPPRRTHAERCRGLRRVGHRDQGRRRRGGGRGHRALCSSQATWSWPSRTGWGPVSGSPDRSVKSTF